MTEGQRALALAAANPRLALQALNAPAIELEKKTDPVSVGRVPGLTLDVEVDSPAPYRRWRFFIFWCLLKLAAWVYPFNFELYRTSRAWERGE